MLLSLFKTPAAPLSAVQVAADNAMALNVIPQAIAPLDIRVRDIELASLAGSRLFRDFALTDPLYAKDVFQLEKPAEIYMQNVSDAKPPSLWEGNDVKNGVVGGVFGGLGGGLVGGVYGGLVGGVGGGVVGGFAGGLGGLIAGVGTAFSVSFAVSHGDPVFGVVGTLASLALCMGVSIAGNIMLPIYRAWPEHTKALHEYQELQSTVATIQNHLDDIEAIEASLQENPGLYQHFLTSKLLPENAKKTTELTEAAKPLQEFLDNYEAYLTELKNRFEKDNPELHARLKSDYIIQHSQVEHEFKEIDENLKLLEFEKKSIEWELQQLAKILAEQQALQGFLKTHLSRLGTIGSQVEYTRLLNERVCLEIVANFLARQKIMAGSLAKFRAQGEVMQIAASFDLDGALAGESKKILAELTLKKG